MKKPRERALSSISQAVTEKDSSAPSHSVGGKQQPLPASKLVQTSAQPSFSKVKVSQRFSLDFDDDEETSLSYWKFIFLMPRVVRYYDVMLVMLDVIVFELCVETCKSNIL